MSDSDVIEQMREAIRTSYSHGGAMPPRHALEAAARVLLEDMATVPESATAAGWERGQLSSGLFRNVFDYARSIGLDLSAPPQSEPAEEPGSTYTFEGASLGDADSKRLIIGPETDTE